MDRFCGGINFSGFFLLTFTSSRFKGLDWIHGVLDFNRLLRHVHNRGCCDHRQLPRCARLGQPWAAVLHERDTATLNPLYSPYFSFSARVISSRS